VVGLDISLEMLGRARARLAGAPRAHPLVADMRRFALRRRFDLIAAPNDPFSHLTRAADRRAALRRAAAHLAPGGRLVIEGLHRPAMAAPSPRALAPDLTVEESWRSAGRPRLWHARYRYRWPGGETIANFRARA